MGNTTKQRLDLKQKKRTIANKMNNPTCPFGYTNYFLTTPDNKVHF